MSRRMILVVAMWFALVGIIADYSYAQSQTPPGERFVLTGVVFGDGGRGLAWLQEPTFTNNLVVSVRVGDSVGPYRLTRISEYRVELEGPSGTVSIPLAGSPATMTAAALPETVQPPVGEPSPHPALNNPNAIVIPRGDPRRNFPASTLLLGAGARLTGGVEDPTSPQAAGALGPLRRLPVTAAMRNPAPEPPAPPSPARNNSNAIVVPRGDPRRNFPASTLLLGAGAGLVGGAAGQ